MTDPTSPTEPGKLADISDSLPRKRKGKPRQFSREDLPTREVERIVCGDRNRAYGTPLANHGLTAEFWAMFLASRRNSPGQDGLEDYREGRHALDVCALHVLTKIARLVNDPTHRDSWIDVMGYGLNALSIIDDWNPADVQPDKEPSAATARERGRWALRTKDSALYLQPCGSRGPVRTAYLWETLGAARCFAENHGLDVEVVQLDADGGE